jgi:predicted CXXCH cytochrome family protein
MKKTILLAAAFSFVIAGAAHAATNNSGGSHLNNTPGSGIIGTVHDLSTGGVITYTPDAELDRICIWCHAPHHAMQLADSAGIDYLPLWNHGVRAQLYNGYQSDFGGGPATTGAGAFADAHVFNGEATQGEPGAVSRLCLSCHDGTVAVNEYGRIPQRDYSRQAGSNMILDQYKIGAGGNLVNHHPIGFSYTDALSMDDELAPVTTALGTGGTIIGSLLYNDTLNSDMMECVTCHDVHNTKNEGETLLWTTNRQSAFCLVCHLKGV